MNMINFAAKKYLRTEMRAWSNDVYEAVPFTCEEKMDDAALSNRLHAAVSKRFKPSHHAGCGYSCTLSKVVRETPTSGYAEICHYHGIGD